MSSDFKHSITLYDIASKPPLSTFAPNPWKTRLALNFKGVPYQTQWTPMPDIRALREELGVPANRTLPDGTPFHTLPVIQDTSTGKLVGDTFEIATYLDSAYPDRPQLFRPFTTGLVAALNAQVDGIFTKYAILCTEMPFDPSVQDKIMEMFASRFGGAMPTTTPEQEQKILVEFEAALGELAKAYRHTGGTTDYFWRAGGTEEGSRQRPPQGREEPGVFLDGDSPVYADFIVGAWLKMFQVCLKNEHWDLVKTWQGGLWGRVVDALEKWSEMK